MSKLYLLLLIFFFSDFTIKSQDIKAEIYDPPIPYYGNVGDWGTDYVVSPTEPFGEPSGVYRTTNNTIYVSVPDTNILANRCVVILRSTNNGANWVIHSSVSPAAIVPKTKMITRPGSDSVYCFLMVGSSVYSWNIINNNFNLFSAFPDLRDFDVAMSSTGSLYLIVDLRLTNQVYWQGTANGGSTWGSQIYMSATAVRPRIYMSATGDTALIIYYGVTIQSDTNTSAVRFVRYRETAPGTMTSVVGSFTTIINAGVPKDQIGCVRHGMNSWILFTTGLTGNINLNCIVSTDGGTNYGAPITIGSLPSRDEYWFSAKHYAYGIDLIFYSDSLQGGPPTNSSDKMFSTYATNPNPSSFTPPVQLSNFPPGWSARGYIPTLFEYFDPNADAGAIWVGIDGANRRLYFDRFNAVLGMQNNGNEIPKIYSLSQNYPNPFNPTTKIDFSIPVGSYVSIKVFDILGRESAVILNKDMKAGSYTVDFDASNLSSGVYFYKLITRDFIATKKMVIVK